MIKRQIPLPLVLVDAPPVWACVRREFQGPARKQKEDACLLKSFSQRRNRRNSSQKQSPDWMWCNRRRKKGIVALHPSSSTYFIVEELTGANLKLTIGCAGS